MFIAQNFMGNPKMTLILIFDLGIPAWSLIFGEKIEKSKKKSIFDRSKIKMELIFGFLMKNWLENIYLGVF